MYNVTGGYDLSLYQTDHSKVWYFLRVDQSNRQVLVFPLSSSDIGNYQFVVRVSEILAPSYYSEYIINLNITNTTGTTTPAGLTPLYG